MKNIYKLKFLTSLLAALFCLNTYAQTTLEFDATSASGSGPAFTSPAFTFISNTDNPLGNNFVPYTPAISATFSVSNPKYTGVGTFSIGGVSNPAAFGAKPGSVNTQNFNIPFLNAPPTNNFTSGSMTGFGINSSATAPYNTGVSLFTSTGALEVNNLATTGTYYMTDMTITFSTAVNNPSLHLAGIGANTYDSFGTPLLGFSTQYELVSINGSATPPPSTTVTRVSGNGTFAVANNLIYNNAATVDGTNDANGTAKINATNVTSLKFKVYIKGDRSTAITNWSDGNTFSGDAVSLSVSFQICNAGAFAPALSSTSASVCGTTNFNLTTVAASNTPPGTVLKWYNSAALTTEIAAPTSVSGGTYYAAFYESVNNCKSPYTVFTVIRDSDCDGIGDIDDLDDDNDGILDTAEGTTPVCLNLSSITRATPNIITPVKNYVNGTSGYSVDVTAYYTTTLTAAELPTQTPNAPVGYNDGHLALGTYSSYKDEAHYMQYTFYFSTPVKVKISPKLSTIPFNFDGPDSWRITASNGDVIATSSTNIIVDNAGANDIVVTPATPSNTTATGWAIETTQQVNSITLKMWSNSTATVTNMSPLRICIDAPIDSDNDLIPNYLDFDSDGDGCADAIEGSENVKFAQVHSINLPSTDPNFAYRGQIKVIYDGVSINTPANIVSTSPAANGVPQLVNNTGNNLHPTTNPSNLAGVADNTDGTADIGQGIGTSEDATKTDLECTRCFRPANTTGTALDTKHGVTALGRAGVNNGNWPMKIKGAYTVLDAKTKGFVINRLTTAQINALAPAQGMMVYNVTINCLYINTDGTNTGWKCANTQTCDDLTK